MASATPSVVLPPHHPSPLQPATSPQRHRWIRALSKSRWLCTQAQLDYPMRKNPPSAVHKQAVTAVLSISSSTHSSPAAHTQVMTMMVQCVGYARPQSRGCKGYLMVPDAKRLNQALASGECDQSPRSLRWLPLSYLHACDSQAVLRKDLDKCLLIAVGWRY